MNLIKTSKLGESGSNKTTFSTTEALKGNRNESKHFKKENFSFPQYDELQDLESAIAFLNKESMDIYIDWLDDGMPKITGRITTARINENNKFFLASEWCN